ncbi:hypothetical protein [Pseudooctadecabacter sp.]|uniref:hypothetical protein n=1 Tax=Pseudooctadecabacter sp. TaxID=1966338 RepID=UPI0025E6B003|nr:hypothetical protein [Pseudooctadecabacter sp.]
MLKFMKTIREEEDGAVTVDWVVLCAVIIGLSIALIAIIGAGATNKSSSVGAFLSAQSIATY